jgi:hypothetical protein
MNINKINKENKMLNNTTLEIVKNRVAEFTDTNYHTECAYYIAETLGTDQDLEIAKYIQREHNKLGHMQPALISIRTRLINDVLNRLDPETAKQIGECL